MEKYTITVRPRDAIFPAIPVGTSTEEEYKLCARQSRNSSAFAFAEENKVKWVYRPQDADLISIVRDVVIFDNEEDMIRFQLKYI